MPFTPHWIKTAPNLPNTQSNQYGSLQGCYSNFILRPVIVISYYCYGFRRLGPSDEPETIAAPLHSHVTFSLSLYSSILWKINNFLLFCWKKLCYFLMLSYLIPLDSNQTHDRREWWEPDHQSWSKCNKKKLLWRCILEKVSFLLEKVSFLLYISPNLYLISTSQSLSSPEEQ